MAHILAMRFSALGDVAMTVPVIYSFAKHYPQHEVTVLSHSRFSYLFDFMPPNVRFRGIDLNFYRGISGLNELYSEVSKTKFDAIADLHNVLRTKFLRARFRIDGCLVATIDKGNWSKRRLTCRHSKRLEPLLSSSERYARVFAELGYPVLLEFRSVYGAGHGSFAEVEPLTGVKSSDQWIGVAPFAQHRGKVYPANLMERVVELLACRAGTKVFLFGGGSAEKSLCETWASRHEGVVSLVGRSNLNVELNVMSHLDVMVSMDSANMHLASIAGVPVVSIWGATHRYVGFMGWGQTSDNVVEEDLPCRPCSVYGKKPCLYGHYNCLSLIAPERIVERVVACLEKS